ncbi:MAG TPA: hypothetical protein VGR10_06160, partial [Thermoleophilaceae bacterium]|nr:hypothetical protein [Thermoleophilaceae bacterium]
AWVLWRTAALTSSLRRRRLYGPEVAVAQVAWGLDEQELAALVSRLAAAAGGEPRDVLVISDSDAVHVAAAAGCRFEHLPPRADWERRIARGDYEAFARRRVASILAGYRVGRLID